MLRPALEMDVYGKKAYERSRCVISGKREIHRIFCKGSHGCFDFHTIDGIVRVSLFFITNSFIIISLHSISLAKSFKNYRNNFLLQYSDC